MRYHSYMYWFSFIACGISLYIEGTNTVVSAMLFVSGTIFGCTRDILKAIDLVVLKSKQGKETFVENGGIVALAKQNEKSSP